MSPLQIVAVALTVVLNALDGFDVLSISFASPDIAKAWSVDKAALGRLLSMELIGMMVGSVLLGGLADKLGRRPTILGCLTIMAIGMAMAAQAHGLTDLSIWRLLTGVGIGGMLAATNAAAAEFSNLKRRGLSLSLMAIGFPLGGVIGGQVVGALLKGGDWRQIFVFGAIATASLVPVVWFFMPETVTFLAQRRPADALGKINRVLIRLGRRAIAALPAPDPATPTATLSDLLKPPYLILSIILITGYFAHMVSFYFLIKWAPKIAVDALHVAPGMAAGVLTWANLGGAVGGGIFGLLTARFGLRGLTIVTLLGSSVMIAVYGLGQTSLTQMSLVAAATQFFANAGVVGLYSLAARTYPPELRGTGTGLMIGLGRGGAAVSPILVGWLFQQHFGLANTALTVAAGSLVAAGILAFLRPVSWATTPTGEGRSSRITSAAAQPDRV